MYNSDDLKDFTKAALTGLLSNPVYNDMNVAKHMQMKDLTQEKLAVKAAVACLTELSEFLKESARGKPGEQLELSIVPKED